MLKVLLVCEEPGMFRLRLRRLHTHPERHSAIELINKLCDTQFARKAKAADFLCKIWDVMRDAGAGRGDKVRALSRPGIHWGQLIVASPRFWI